MAKIDSRIARVGQLAEDVQDIKDKIANVASNKNVSINYGTDTMVDVLDNINNGTIPTPSGTLSITSNNTYDVTNYASADVNVVPSLQNKSVTITTNGTQTISADVGYDGLNEVEVTTNVSGGGSGQDYLAQNLKGILKSYSNSEIYNLRENAFYYNQHIQNVSLPNCVYGGTYAFNGCVNLKQVNMENCLALSNNVFGGCTRLEQVSLPNLQRVSGNCFTSCLYLSILDLPNCFIVSSSAFSGCIRLIDVSLPNCIYIQQAAFSGCSKMETVNIPNLVGVNSSIFQYCFSLGSVNFPLLSLCNDSMFYSCIRLSFASLQNCLTIGFNAFCGCKSLKSIICATQQFSASAFYNCSSLESVYILNARSNANFGLNATTFNNTPIVDSSYLGYYGSIYVPSQILASLKTQTNWVSISDRLAELPASFSSNYIYANEFSGSTLTEVPSDKVNCQNVLQCAFANCSYLSQVNLPNASCITTYTFANCNSLSQVSLPNCKVIEGLSAFTGCPLNQLYLPNCEYVISVGTPYSLSIDLPKCKFYFGNRSAPSLSLPNCVIMGPNTITGGGTPSVVDLPNCRTLANRALFSGRASQYSLPNCEYVGVQAFLSCNMSSIELPKCLMLDTNAFANCNNLSQLSLPNCRIVMSLTFYSCSRLKVLSLPNCVQIANVGNCSRLSQVIIGTSLSEICYATSQSMFASTPIADSSYLGYYGSIYVPDSLVSTYQTATYWSAYSDRITGISNLPSI